MLQRVLLQLLPAMEAVRTVVMVDLPQTQVHPSQQVLQLTMREPFTFLK
jgi:hypothetical protein